MAGIAWVRGIGDRLLARIADWARRWPEGKEAGTRPFLRHDGLIEEVVTLRAVDVDWDIRELDYLISILKARKPGWYMTEEFLKIRRSIRHARLLPGGLRRVEMVTYADEPRQVLEEVLAVRDGRPAAETLAEQVVTGDFWSGAE